MQKLRPQVASLGTGVPSGRPIFWLTIFLVTIYIDTAVGTLADTDVSSAEDLIPPINVMHQLWSGFGWKRSEQAPPLQNAVGVTNPLVGGSHTIETSHTVHCFTSQASNGATQVILCCIHSLHQLMLLHSASEISVKYVACSKSTSIL